MCVTGYSELDRHIELFMLDEESRSGCFGNPGPREDWMVYGGGGGFACGCKVSPGKKVKLSWEIARNFREFEANEPKKMHEAWVTIPQPESSRSPYLRIYFMADGTTPLQWVDDMGAVELEPTLKKNDSADGQPRP